MTAQTAPLHVGRFAILERIGGNSTSAVHAAYDEVADRRVALKMIAADVEDDEEARTRFYREARVTSELHHPNIVSVLDVGEEQGRPFIAMELLDGRSLDERLRDASVPLAEALSLGIQLCAGLQAAHDQAVVHRDLKPSNLFVTSDGVLKILDFGLARLQTSTLTAHGSVLGTPDFMSPEQAEGRRVDHRSDIFSAAAVVSLLVTGISPFARGDLQRTLNALLNNQPAGLDSPAMPAAVREVLERALSTSVDVRQQTARELGDDLARVARDLSDEVSQ